MAVSDLTLRVEHGQFAVLLGPSGCGKSTTLRLIAGLEEPDQGEILISDKVVNSLPPQRRNLAMVFQSYVLYPHMTVAQNMGFGLKMRGVPAVESRDRVLTTARLLGLEELLERYPGQLSGGQKLRVSADPDSPVKAGETVSISIPPENLHFFEGQPASASRRTPSDGIAHLMGAQNAPRLCEG